MNSKLRTAWTRCQICDPACFADSDMCHGRRRLGGAGPWHKTSPISVGEDLKPRDRLADLKSHAELSMRTEATGTLSSLHSVVRDSNVQFNLN